MLKLFCFLIFSMAIGYCCGVTFGFGKEERMSTPIIASIVGFIGLMYFIWLK